MVQLKQKKKKKVAPVVSSPVTEKQMDVDDEDRINSSSEVDPGELIKAF